MKAAQFYGGADIRVAEAPTPEPGPGEVLVRVRAAGICGSDLHGYRQRRRGQSTPATPTLKGHELAGEVAAWATAWPVYRLATGLPWSRAIWSAVGCAPIAAAATITSAPGAG